MIGVTCLLSGALFLAIALCGHIPWPRVMAIRILWDGIAVLGNELAPQVSIVNAVSSGTLWWLGASATWPGATGISLSICALLLALLALVRSWRDAAWTDDAVLQGLGPQYRQLILPERTGNLRKRVPLTVLLRPFNFDLAGIDTIADVSYGPHGEFNRLDILRPSRQSVSALPVLLHIHGGALVMGRKNVEALPLLHHMVRRGWLVVTIDYRLSPVARWPAHIEDAKRAVAWIRRHIGAYGGDPEFVAATGGSAGGYLAALLALCPDERKWQPGFESDDTRIQASVPFYGSYDILAPGSLERLIDMIIDRTREADPACLDAASPKSRVRADAPPFFVLHGALDTLVPVRDAREFVGRLRSVSLSPVVYAEQAGANHGFDAQHSLRAEGAVDAVHRFLEYVYSNDLRSRGRTSSGP